MDSVGVNVIETAALGRPFQLGMLYDCRKDALIPGITLWDKEQLQQSIRTHPQINTNFKVTASDSIEDKSSVLNIDSCLEMSLLGGLLYVGGAAKYLNDTKKSFKQQRLTLHYHSTSKFEELTMNHLASGNIAHHEVFENDTATHVVTAVLYGADACFVFDREVSADENESTVAGELQVAYDKLKGISVDHQNHPGSCILLYENGCDEAICFAPPTKPACPIIKQVRDGSVVLKVPPPCHATMKLKLLYKMKEEKSWKSQPVMQSQITVTLTDLNPDTKYEIKCAAVGKLNYTVDSDVIRVITERTTKKVEPEDLGKFLLTHHLSSSINVLQKYLKRQDLVELNIGVTGESGSGKSTFVNAFRGLGDEEEGSATTGPVETTIEPEVYLHPKYKKLKVWDLPGIGTPNFKADEYLELVQFERYDFFIIIASDRFRECQAQLAKQIRRMRKTFYFVRSKVDSIIDSQRRKKNFDLKKTLDTIREDCEYGLRRIGIEDTVVFLISSWEPQKYDFNLLQEQIEKDFPQKWRRRTKMRLLCVFALVAVVGLVAGEEGARLLASKSLLNRYAVEGRDLTLQYNIYNVGTSAALEVELSDDSFPPEDFGIVSGMLNVKWDRIAPASNVSHTVVLRPLKAGYFNFTSASVSYLAQEGGQVVVGYTSAPGQGGILAQREFDRRFSPHYLDWAAFGVMTLPSIGIPLLLWYSSKRKYDSPKSKKN
ncbi:hypothetical protein Q8A67_015687 [Cirrhinus molitorella]|uniref:Translocon-associated protein subunit beta n=1 Tax=Cirrhinus molitorella TaxID=172907 RepID=A0AA88PMU0_9TELE|nr:hypothetical protein Q8A67_015687 [Cirrhinus molitorella]